MAPALVDVTRSPFSARLKEARIAAGLTQQALGEKAGLSTDVARIRINRYERGVHDCDSRTALRIARALGVPLPSLYAESAEMAQAIVALCELSSEDLKVLACRSRRSFTALSD